ncbi:Conserved hypothetical protein CHP02231, partial [Aphelenchoides avenae]
AGCIGRGGRGAHYVQRNACGEARSIQHLQVRASRRPGVLPVRHDGRVRNRVGPQQLELSASTWTGGCLLGPEVHFRSKVDNLRPPSTRGSHWREVRRRARSGLGRQGEVHVRRAVPQAVRRQEDFDVDIRQKDPRQEPEGEGEGPDHHPPAGAEIDGQQDQ